MVPKLSLLGPALVHKKMLAPPPHQRTHLKLVNFMLALGVALCGVATAALSRLNGQQQKRESKITASFATLSSDIHLTPTSTNQFLFLRYISSFILSAPPSSPAIPLRPPLWKLLA